jgi:hypothetical protein
VRGDQKKMLEVMPLLFFGLAFKKPKLILKIVLAVLDREKGCFGGQKEKKRSIYEDRKEIVWVS